MDTKAKELYDKVNQITRIEVEEYIKLLVDDYRKHEEPPVTWEKQDLNLVYLLRLIKEIKLLEIKLKSKKDILINSEPED